MKTRDRKLGMNCPITRRDLLHGAGLLAGSSMLPGLALADAVLAAEKAGQSPFPYPPGLTGMRGNHPGSYDSAHSLAREGRRSWGLAHEADDGIYDLVVVGAGVSGLSAAFYYQQAHPKARILLLDNHDDFGGHARRNEFQVGGKTLIGYGGSQAFEDPQGYSRITHAMLRELGIDLERFETAYDQSFLRSNGLTGGVFFNREQWGSDQLVPFDLGTLQSYLPLAPSPLTAAEAVTQMPISGPAQQQLLNLLTNTQDCLAGMSVAERVHYLRTTSYRDFISAKLAVSEPDVFRVLQDLSLDSTVGIEATPALGAMSYSGLPGWQSLAMPDEGSEEPYIHHFPDGNASVARLLVRRMIPRVAPGNSMDDVVRARFDYSKLDQSGEPVRLRLNSTAVRVAQEGGAGSAGPVHIDYVRGGQTLHVTAKACVLACYHSIIPFLCPDLPATQKKALAWQVKAPILYTNVALRNWRAWKNLGVGCVTTPGGYHTVAMLDFPVSMGGYEFAQKPDDPVIVHMERFVHRNNEGLDVEEQHRLGCHELLATSFQTIEREVRAQLAGMLAGGGFDPARDIEAITVNRWAHGYSRGYNTLFDTVYKDRQDERYPHVQARQPFGRITIANCDANASAWLPAAIEQAHRAVSELAFLL